MFTVEICGCTGTGKSSVVHELLKYPNYKLLNKRKCKDWTGCTLTEQNKLALNYINTNFKQAKGERIKTRHLHTLRSFIQVIYGKTIKSNNIGIIDGGLMHRGTTLQLACPQVNIDEYYRLIPLAHLTIYLYDYPDVIIQRNKKRGGDHDRSKDVSRMLNIYDRALKIIDERSAYFCTLRTDKEPTIVAASINEIITDARHNNVHE